MQNTVAHRRLAEQLMFKSIWDNVLVPDSLVKLVAITFTEEEAEIVSALYGGMLPAWSVARKVKRPVREVKPILKSLAERVLVGSLDTKVGTAYTFLPLLPGIFESQIILSRGREDEHIKEFARLFEEVYEEILSWIKPKIQHKDLRWGRIIPIEHALNVTPGANVLAFSTDKYSEMVERNNSFCLMDRCACRQEKIFIGEGCGKPLDVCSAMGWLADIAIEKGLARRVSKEEFLEAKTRAVEAGLVNMVDNMENPLQVCSCCGCCCSALRVLTQFNIPTVVVQSHFEAQVNGESCVGCGTCVTFCPMKAVTLKGEQASIDYTRCIGCGVCVVKCPQSAIILRERKTYQPPARTPAEFALNRYFEIKGYEHPLLPKLSLGVGRLIDKVVPLHISGPKYKAKP